MAIPTLSPTTTLVELAEILGHLTGQAQSVPTGAELREHAQQIRTARNNGNSPERGDFGQSDEIDSLIGLMREAGASTEDVREVEHAWSDAAHSAEDAAILEADDEARADDA